MVMVVTVVALVAEGVSEARVKVHPVERGRALWRAVKLVWVMAVTTGKTALSWAAA